MQSDANSPITPDMSRPPRTVLRRVVRHTLRVKLVLVLICVVTIGGFYLRLFAGPLSLGGYSRTLAEALEKRLGPGWSVSVSDTALELQGGNPAVRTFGLEIRNPSGLGLRAPEAVVSLDPLSLVVGVLAPREIELRDLQLRAFLTADGSLRFTSGDGGEAGPAAVSSPREDAPAASAMPSSVARAVGSLLEPVLAPTGIVGSLDRARVTNARLTLVGADGHERVGFSRVNATFARAPGEVAGGGETRRNLALDLVGPHGGWGVSGSVRATGDGRRADLDAHDVPLDDIVLLSGLAPVAADSGLKLSGTIAVAFEGPRLSVLEGRLRSTPGQIARDGQTPVRIDALGGAARWDEGARRLDLSDVALKSGTTELGLAGTLLPRADGAWALQLGGRDARFAGVSERDPAVKVDDLDARVTFAEGAVTLDGLRLKGEAVDVTVTANSVAAADGQGVDALITATRTDVRRLFALWPDMINPELRRYLTANMRIGTLEKLEIRTNLDPADFRNATSGKPISDGALDLRFDLTGTTLTVIDGLPALRGLSVTGRATGTTTVLAAPRGYLEMPDGRRLGFTEGTYAQRDEHKPGSVADIAFRIDGGADALASFLRQPIFKDFGSFEMDPNALKGRVDLRAQIPLVVAAIPRAADLPLVVNGTLSDISAERVFGRDKLEAGQFVVTYASGAMTLHGDGRLAGSPATIDLRQPRGQPIDAHVALTLDEAARTRRSLPSGPQLTGPVLVKAATTLGAGARSPLRMEADLTRAGIDGLLPGWTKPAGRPGRMTFTMPTGEAGDIRDIAVDAGTVQIRGNAGFGPDGSLERADLSTVKLSQGDDARAQVERSGGVYRIALRGNVVDARPVLKSLTAGSAASGGTSGKGKEVDVDVDLAVNILTGHNDEALTGAVAKVSLRNREIKALQVKGQFRAAALEIRMARREGGPPIVEVQSGDAGATLRFVDLYRRISGGVMLAQTTTGDVQAGTVTIDNFTVRNEPALKRIASQIPAGSDPDERRDGVRIEGDQVQFAKLTAEFRRTASRVEYKDVVVWGAQAGFNVSGFVDYARDRTDITGTFVPAYGLNNAFSQLPLIGAILGGGRNEGLFAVDFRVSGPATSPTLTINPLSVVAPGILRKLFGWALPSGEDATGTTAPPRGPAAARPSRRPEPQP